MKTDKNDLVAPAAGVSTDEKARRFEVLREEVLKEAVTLEEALDIVYASGHAVFSFDAIKFCPRCGERVGIATLKDPHTGSGWSEIVEFEHREYNDLKTGEPRISIESQTFCPYTTHWCD